MNCQNIADITYIIYLNDNMNGIRLYIQQNRLSRMLLFSVGDTIYPHQRPFNWIQRPAPPSCLLASDRSALFQYHMLLFIPPVYNFFFFC